MCNVCVCMYACVCVCVCVHVCVCVCVCVTLYIQVHVLMRDEKLCQFFCASYMYVYIIGQESHIIFTDNS